MPEPVTLTAATIAALAFPKFLESSAGELGKQMAGGTLEQVNQLRQHIIQRLRGRSAQVDGALGQVDGGDRGLDRAALETLAQSLEGVMAEDTDFAQTLQKLVETMLKQQLDNHQSAESATKDQVKDETENGSKNGAKNIGVIASGGAVQIGTQIVGDGNLLGRSQPDHDLAWIDEHEPKEQLLADLKAAIEATKSGQTFPLSDLWDDLV